VPEGIKRRSMVIVFVEFVQSSFVSSTTNFPEDCQKLYDYDYDNDK